MERKIFISETVKAAWKALKAQIWILVGLVIGYTIISLLLSLFQPASIASITISGIAVCIVGLLFSLVFELGYLKNLFQALDGDEPQFSAYGQQSRRIFTYFLASILYAVVVCVGLALFIVPGIYLGLRLQFYAMSIVEEDAGIVSSLKRSWEITKGHGGRLFLLLLVCTGFALLGVIAFVIGIFVVYPLIGLMTCHVFRKLTVSTESFASL
jgi:uncharacterized membrane protein